MHPKLPANRRLVFGASGYIGSDLVPYLLAIDVPVRACARHIEVLQARGWQGVEIAGADALDATTLPAALKDIDWAYYLVHSMAAGRNFGRRRPHRFLGGDWAGTGTAPDAGFWHARTRVTATAYWHPAGVLGLIYWYSLEPTHRIIFDGMTREIARRAEALS